MDHETTLATEHETQEAKELTLDDLETVAGGMPPFEPEGGSGDGTKLGKIPPPPPFP
jgi:hypothetical protein